MPRPRSRPRLLPQLLVIATGALLVAGEVTSGHAASGPVTATRAYAREATRSLDVVGAVRARRVARLAARGDAEETLEALEALSDEVHATSHPEALATAFRSYFAYRARHPEQVRKPYLYFVDYGLPSTTPRGYVFDMEARTVVEGPFMVAHGRGSSRPQEPVPSRFSNAIGSASTSLGLYVAQELYDFRGKMGGQHYRSVGLRLQGVSGRFNDLARTRGVVAHGAPYVTAGRAGRSEGCPAVEQERAERLLPKLARGGLVFLFAPEARWMASDPWAAGPSLAGTAAEGRTG